MVTPTDPRYKAVLEIASGTLDAILKRRKMTGADLARITEARGGVTKRVIYHTLDKTQPPKLQTLLDYAEALHVPVWIFLVPEVRQYPELLDPGALEPLITLIQNYMKADPDKRPKIERMAQAMSDYSDIEK